MNKKKIIDINKFSTVQKIYLSIIILIMFIIGTKLFEYFRNQKDSIDYKSANIDTFLNDAEESYDRQVYWNLNDIISKFVLSYQTVEKLDDSLLVEYRYTGYSLDEYYKALDTNYQKYLGKSGYIKLAKQMLSKFATKNENGIVISTDKIIEKMYKVNDENVYICKLNAVENSKSSYIVIKLDTEKKNYSILYLE